MYGGVGIKAVYAMRPITGRIELNSKAVMSAVRKFNVET
jgi:hypothetical protein